jgi:hypothetical protein
MNCPHCGQLLPSVQAGAVGVYVVPPTAAAALPANFMPIINHNAGAACCAPYLIKDVKL